jgi:4-hydroxy-3-polyprenylbenzoate decarboxylase
MSKGCLMGYRSLAECVRDLEATGQLIIIEVEVDPFLEVAAIQRRVHQAAGPALLFRNIKGTAFPVVGNLFGTLKRTKYLFRDALKSVRMLVELKVDPGRLARNPWRYRGLAGPLWRLSPRRARNGPILANQTTLDQLPQIQCWPMDGGPFITLPLVYTEDPNRPGPARSNLGM